MFFDTGCCNPFAEWIIYHASGESTKDFTFCAFTTELQSFITDREHRFRVCLLYSDADAIAKVGSQLDVIPCEIENVADS